MERHGMGTGTAASGRNEEESRPTGPWGIAASSSRNGFRRFYCRADYNLGAAFRVVKGVLSGSVRKRYLRFGVVLSSEQQEGVWYTWRPAKLIVVKWVRFAARISLNKMWWISASWYEGCQSNEAWVLVPPAPARTAGRACAR